MKNSRKCLSEYNKIIIELFSLASTWESNTQFFLEWKQVVFPSLEIYIGEFLMRVGGGVSSCV